MSETYIKVKSIVSDLGENVSEADVVKRWRMVHGKLNSWVRRYARKIIKEDVSSPEPIMENIKEDNIKEIVMNGEDSGVCKHPCSKPAIAQPVNIVEIVKDCNKSSGTFDDKSLVDSILDMAENSHCKRFVKNDKSIEDEIANIIYSYTGNVKKATENSTVTLAVADYVEAVTKDFVNLYYLDFVKTDPGYLSDGRSFVRYHKPSGTWIGFGCDANTIKDTKEAGQYSLDHHTSKILKNVKTAFKERKKYKLNRKITAQTRKVFHTHYDNIVAMLRHDPENFEFSNFKDVIRLVLCDDKKRYRHAYRIPMEYQTTKQQYPEAMKMFEDRILNNEAYNNSIRNNPYKNIESDIVNILVTIRMAEREKEDIGYSVTHRINSMLQA
jgi:hypothetical protein